MDGQLSLDPLVVELPVVSCSNPGLVVGEVGQSFPLQIISSNGGSHQGPSNHQGWYLQCATSAVQVGAINTNGQRVSPPCGLHGTYETHQPRVTKSLEIANLWPGPHVGQHQNTGGGAIHEPFGIIITPFGSNGLTTSGFTRHSGPNCGPILFGKQKDPPSPNGLPFLWVV